LQANLRTGGDIAVRRQRDRWSRETENAARKVVTHVALNPARASRRADQAQGHGRLTRDRAGVLEPRLHRGGVEQQLGRVLYVAERGVQAFQSLLFASFFEVERDSAGPDHAATEAA